MKARQAPDGRWYVQYRVHGRKSPVKEYFGRGEEAKAKAKVRALELKLAKAKGQAIRAHSRMYLDELAQLFLDDAKARGVGRKWREEFENLLNKYILPDLCQRPVDQLEHQDIVHLAARWAEPDIETGKTRSPATINRYMGYLKAVFTFGIDHDYTRTTPMKKWQMARELKREVNLTVEDLERLMRHAAPHLAWAIEVAWELGARPGPSELLSIRWDDVDFSGCTVHVRGTKTVGANRLLPITPAFRDRLLIMGQMAKTEYLIEYNGRPLKKFRRSVKTAARKAGIKYDVRMYDIRHLFASIMLAGGADLAAVSRLMGHADITTTQRKYYHLLKGEMERATATRPTIRPKKKVGKVVNIR